jgi:hypothetical protein
MESGAEGTKLSSSSVVWIIIITLFLGFVWYSMSAALDVAEISRNWPKYRCSPSVMPFASWYGYNTSENFNYCLQNIFQGQLGAVTGPFGSILGTIIQNLMKFLQNLNSLRVMLATMVGGVSKMFQEFLDRFKLLMSQVRTTGQHMKFLMGRVFATFYAVMYMGLSALTAGLNFGDTAIFGFLDTFCFAPETVIQIEGKGYIMIQDVRLGDVCKVNGARVTSIYRFAADGQPMVKLKGVHVSTNHFVMHNGKMIQADEHPDAEPAGVWKGGSTRPLICLDTDSHTIPIGGYIFSDWDETCLSDQDTMIVAEEMVNGMEWVDKDQPRPWLYQPAMDQGTLVKLMDGTMIHAGSVKPGMILSNGLVTGIGRRAVYTYVQLPNNGPCMTPSTLIWNEHKWVRAGHLYPDRIVHTTEPRVMTVLVVMSSAVIETDTCMIRDMCEVHSPDMEKPTMLALNPTVDKSTKA